MLIIDVAVVRFQEAPDHEQSFISQVDHNPRTEVKNIGINLMYDYLLILPTLPNSSDPGDIPHQPFAIPTIYSRYHHCDFCSSTQNRRTARSDALKALRRDCSKDLVGEIKGSRIPHIHFITSLVSQLMEWVRWAMVLVFTN